MFVFIYLKHRDRREAVSHQVRRNYYWGICLYYRHKQRCCQATFFLFYLKYLGDLLQAKTILTQALTWKPNTPSGRKEVNSMPSPFGEGQTDTPINRHYLGEVPTNPSPVSPKGERLRHPRTEPRLGNPTRHRRRKEVNSMPSPLGEGQTDMPINLANQGEVTLPPPHVDRAFARE